MLPRTPFQQFVAPTLDAFRRRLAEKIWHEVGAAVAVEAAEPTAEHHPAAAGRAMSFEPVDGPHHWGRSWQQRWWRASFEPVDGAWLSWDDQAEATVFTDEPEPRAVAGFDAGHCKVRLPAGASSVLIESCCMRTGIWVHGSEQGLDPQGSRWRGASLWRRDDEHFEAFHDVDALIDVMALLHHGGGKLAYGQPMQANVLASNGHRPPIERVSPLFRKLCRRLDQAVAVYDREGVAALREALAAIYADFPAERHALRGVLTGHAHIDLVWLWPEKAGVFKAVHSFANVLGLQERYPELVFGYSQPASYAAVGDREPAVLDRVKQKIAGGTWEATGAMWVESDTQLPCGEALVRSVELGQRGFEDLRDEASRVLWLPDVFGYSACVPQILAGFGVPYFYTTKLHWSSAVKHPYTSFVWRGHDGSEVVSHVSRNAYNCLVRADELLHNVEEHREADVHDAFLLPAGYGDGGGGPTDDIAARARRFADLATMPRCGWGGIEDFFDDLAEVRDELPTWHGEMYLEYHRGVQTTQARMKAAYRRAERALQASEAARAVTGRGPAEEGDAWWRRVCFHQFHDDLPGSSIREVYDESVADLDRVADAALADAAAVLHDEGGGGGGGGGEPCLFNPLAVERVALHEGRSVRLPPLAGVVAAAAERVEDDVAATAGGITSGRVEARFDDAGHVAALAVDGRPLALTGPTRLLTFADHPTVFPAWDIDRPTLSHGVDVPRACEVSVDGGAVTFTRRVGRSSVATTYEVRPGEPVLRVTYEIDWRDTDTLLKLALPTSYAAKDARYGAPFGSVARPNWGGPVEADARFEVPASRWACVGDESGVGAMLVTEAKYGFGCHEGLLHVSLLRSVLETRADDERALRDLPDGDAGRYSDLGRHTVRLALGLHDPADPTLLPARLADTLYTDPIPYTGRPLGAGPLGLDASPGVHPTWARPDGAGGLVLRLNETLGRRSSVALGRSATPVDLKGDEAGGQADTYPLGPCGLLSLRVTRT